MKIQKNIYMAITIIFAITIFLLIIITDKNDTLPLISKHQISSQGDLNRNVVSRNIEPEILRIKNSLDSVELPKDSETVTKIKTNVENALNTWIEFQKLVNSKIVNISLVKNSKYMANYEDTFNGAHYFMVFYSPKGELRQCIKEVLYPDRNDNEIKTYYRLYFSDDFNIERYEDSNNIVCFYPSGSIKSISYTTGTEDTIRYTIKWSEDGTIIRQSSYDKSTSNSLLLEAEEKAKQKLKEIQSNAQIEYEEYQKNINSENIDSNGY